jgi:uncharacterized membrane protein YdjX (TVP38/TMEM64 family)
MSVTRPRPPFSPAEIARARWRLLGLVAVLSCVGMVLLVVLALDARDLGHRLDALGVLAAPALAFAGTLLIAAMVPAGLIAGAAGYALGTAGGTAAALVAATAGAVLCAALGRGAGTPAARSAFGLRIARSAAWLDARPRRSIVMARLVPGLPFNATSYVFGLTGIRLGDVAAGTAIGFAPRCFAYAALGGSLRDVESPQARVALGASVLLAVLVVAVPRLALRGAAPAHHRSDEEAHG